MTVAGVNQNQQLLPTRPQLSQPNSEKLVGSAKARARLFGVQSQQLLPQGKVLLQQVLSGAKNAD
jgi:hypothetical protein